MKRRRADVELQDSELGWIGAIPTDWAIVPTKQVLKLVKRTVGASWSEHQLLSLTKNGVITRDIESNHGKFPESFDTYQAVIPGELVFCLFDVDETPRTVGLAQQPGMVTGAYDCFQTLPSVDHRFAHWYFIAIDDGKRFRPLYSGLRKVIPKPRLLSAGFALPPMAEQLQIADYLDAQTAKIDTLIGKQGQLIETLAERRQAVISQSVTKGLDPTAPMKDSGLAWLGDVPASWEIRGSRRVFRHRNELAKADDTQLTSSQEYGVIEQVRYVQLTGNRVVSVQTGFDILKHVVKGDFVISMRSFQGGLEYAHATGRISSAYVSLAPIDEVIDQYFAYLFKSSRYISALRATSNLVRDGQALRYSNFAQVQIPLPSLTEQAAVAEYLSHVTGQIDVLSKKTLEMINVLKERRQALISAAVTGKIDVRGLA